MAMETEVEEEFVPLQLRPIQHIPPAPNHVRSAMDWMPEYVGYAWLAYGAGSTVVIITTPVPTSKEEAQIGPFFQQLLEPSPSQNDIRAVAWAPVIPSNGVLAIGAGECVYIYEPNSLLARTGNSVPELPLAWRQVTTLSHTSVVHTVEWTESGDGLLVAGFDVVMWRKKDDGWDPLWKSKPEQPHFLASATWLAEGLSATAADDSTSVGDQWPAASNSFSGSSKGKVTIWCWDDEYGLQEAEISHPQPVSMIQWRPSKGNPWPLDFSCPQRQVLLTCCFDGTVRLWIEIDSGRARLDKAFGREVPEKHLRLAFFAGAVIEVNQCLNGILGMDISVMWACETRVESTGNRDRIDMSCLNEVSKGNSIDSCEWLLGVGPNASVAWWSLHCLDDISPPRCPRVHLWKLGTELLPFKLKSPLVETSSGSQAHSILVQAVVQRVGSKLSGPPSSADLFQLLPENIFSWSRLWLPMQAISDSISLEETVSPEANVRKSRWSVAGEILNQEGHSGSIIQVALHPLIDVELAASLDDNGLVLFWSLSSPVEFQMEIPTLVHPAWKLSGKLLDSERPSKSRYIFLAWAPLVLREGQFLLLLGHSQGFDCVLVRKDNSKREMALQLATACTIQLPVPLCEQKLDCIRTVLLPATSGEKCIMVIGLGMGGHLVASWKLGFHVQHENEICLEQSSEYFHENRFGVVRGSVTEPSEVCMNKISLTKRGYHISVEACLPKFVDSNDLDQVTSIAVMSTGNVFSFCQHSEGALDDAIYKTPAFDFATGHSDGALKLWKISDPQESSVSQCQILEFSWHCVGLIKAHKGTVRLVALTNGGNKIATASYTTADKGAIVNIWDAESYFSDSNFVLEDRISLPHCVVALDWLVIGNGQLLLAVAMQNQVLVYSQRRYVGEIPTKAGESAKLHIWICIASICTESYVKDLYWGPKATLVLVYCKHICIISQWSSTADRKSQNNTSPLESGSKNFSLFYADRSIFVNQKSSKDELQSEVLSSNSALSLCTTEDMNKSSSVTSTVNAERHTLPARVSLRSLLEIADEMGGPLPIYHPTVLLHCLLTGNKKRAVASMRHLMAHVSSAIGSVEKGNNFGEPLLSIPQVPLSRFLPFEFSKGVDYDRKMQWGVGAGSTVFSADTGPQLSSSHEGGGSWLTEKPNAHAKDSIEGISKFEVDGFVTDLDKCPRIPGIGDGERIQLLALLDLLAEVSDSYRASQYASLDEPARRFWISVRFAQIHFARKMGRIAAVGELTADSRTIAWAFQSDCQDILFDLCLSNESSWPAMRAFGLGFWFTNVVSLRSRMERLARAQYLKSKDPKDCALLYLVLNRHNVLMGLFKLSKEEKDKPLVGFLGRNFQEEKNKAAALKNAYVLMGRHQFELAIAFFLLGGDPTSAVSVCAKNLGDVQLALVICRLVEGSNGQLLEDLISKQLLPIAEEKKDYWLASLLQWSLGNSIKSFQELIRPCKLSMIRGSIMQGNNPCPDLAGMIDTACIDPNIGQYSAMLAMKTSFRGSMGDSNAIALARWATMKTSGALKRSGLPLEALECLSSSTCVLGKEAFEDFSVTEHLADLFGISGPTKTTDMVVNWISGGVSGKLESISKINLALQYISKFIIEHPHRGSILSSSCERIVARSNVNEEKSQYTLLVEESDRKLSESLCILEQKYSIKAADAIHVLANFAYHHGLLFYWCHLLHASTYQEFTQERFKIMKGLVTFPAATELLQKATEEFCFMLARVVLACGYNISSLQEASVFCISIRDNRSGGYQCFRELVHFAYDLKLIADYMTNQGSHSDEEQKKIFRIIDLLTFVICVAVAWLGKETSTLLALIKRITNGLVGTDSSCLNFDMRLCYEQFYSHLNPTQLYVMEDTSAEVSDADLKQTDGIQNESTVQLIPKDDRWRLIGVCLWSCIVSIVKKQLTKSMNVALENGYGHNSQLQSSQTQSPLCLSSISDSCGKSDPALVLGKMDPDCLGRPLLSALEYISGGLKRQLASYLRHNLCTLPPSPICLWLWNMDSSVKKEVPNRVLVVNTPTRHEPAVFKNNSVTHSHQGPSALPTAGKDRDETFEELWRILVNHDEVCSVLAFEGFMAFQSRGHEDMKGWTRMTKGLTFEGSCQSNTRDKLKDVRVTTVNTSKSKSTGATPKSLPSDDNSIVATEHGMACTRGKTFISFQKPKEVLRRSGELFEAICMNSCNPEQVVVASNRKGLVYLDVSTGESFSESFEHVWSEADWPRNGWAGSESTPVPTFVSPGVGLGRKEGSSLGLGGAMVGLATLARSGKDLTGGGAFGIPGYAGIGAMGLGWGGWEDFEGFIDPPATVENVSTRALASHPLRPLFLVGSNNTHVYLWEFGKVSATATYGVLPAANVPPPYALASVSAVQFDRFGHRFATAALDGTVCAWQLEVGGRSNVQPTESSLCFHQHASDVAFVGASGSILAATGFSPSGVNLVIWDTLAPPTTSRASLVCHEGGARSLAVFDHDIGGGSISPLIVTGGKGGDIGVHDFRFIATGKSKRQRYLKEEHMLPSSPLKDKCTKEQIDTSQKSGRQNSNGMLWYMPKAHLGSISRVSTIPGTNLFLSGSKDGDVKLWDVKTFELLCHWPRVHDKHTFIQPNSRGFGGVVRAAVTDIRVLPHGFLTCGGDGAVRLFQHASEIPNKKT